MPAWLRAWLQSLKDAAHWLGYTYLYVRMLRSPGLYSVPAKELDTDPLLNVSVCGWGGGGRPLVGTLGASLNTPYRGALACRWQVLAGAGCARALILMLCGIS